MANCKVIAVTNQKGGVGKTTTTANLGIGLAQQNKRVLLIDADAQGSLTLSLELPKARRTSRYAGRHHAECDRRYPHPGRLRHSVSQ